MNLDGTFWGTFAEIGAGQEVARWFFSVGGAAGTVAKTMSAYDMTVSDAIYDKAPRYVSRERIEEMLTHEFTLLLGRPVVARPRGHRDARPTLAGSATLTADHPPQAICETAVDRPSLRSHFEKDAFSARYFGNGAIGNDVRRSSDRLAPERRIFRRSISRSPLFENLMESKDSTLVARCRSCRLARVDSHGIERPVGQGIGRTAHRSCAPRHTRQGTTDTLPASPFGLYRQRTSGKKLRCVESHA